ncbi:MAG: PEGA domain-containing protein [Planctomycetes bacterium]|nr:PEGA domain-containing protein [Planctomycetota bacterium]
MATLILLAIGGVVTSSLGQEPLRIRRDFMGMHNLKDGGPEFRVGMDWTKHMTGGTGYVFDWVFDYSPTANPHWVGEAMARNLVPCVRVQECNGGCTPDPGYAVGVAQQIITWKLAHPQYADRIVYMQLWNEPGDPRDYVPMDVYADYLVAAYNGIKQVEATAAQTNPDIAGTFRVMTPGQNGANGWQTAFTHNPDAKFAFDVWATHPYPEAAPPHYNHHDGDVYIERSKTIDSYVEDIDVVAMPHGNPPRSRRGFPIMITETAYGDHLGISYEGWPKTNRQMAADYNVSAFGTFWYQWPEIVAVHPFILCNMSWDHFAFVQSSSGSTDSNGDGVLEPTAPYPQYTAVRNLRISLESQNKLAPARLTPYRGAVGHIAGAITRADNGQPVKYATIFTDGYEFGHMSLYDGLYEVHNVPVGSYTLSVQKNGYATISRPITVTANQTTTADFSLTYTGKTSRGFYWVDTFNGDSGCSGCSLYAPYLGQTVTTPSDVAFIKYAACKPNVDGVTMKFTIRQGGPTGVQIGVPMYATLESGVGGNMIGGEWPDGQEPAVEPNTTYFLRVERSDGQSVYCYASDSNPYSGGMCYVNGNPQPGWDLYGCIRGLTPAVNIATGTIAGTVTDTTSQPIADVTVSTSPGGYAATTNGSGQYTIDDVPIGSYSVTASKSGYSTDTQNGVMVNEGETTTVNFSLEAGPTTGTVSGWVKDNSSNPISGAVVQTLTGGYVTTTAGDGTYTLANVVPGTYTVQAAKNGYLTQQSAGVNVAAGSITTVNFNLSLQAPFSGICNGNFEGGSFNDPDVDHKTPTCWHGYTVSGVSKWGDTWFGSAAHSPDRVFDMWESTFVAGAYQTATNASAGSIYTAKVWVRGAGNTYWIGLDPTGGTSASGAGVQWSDPTTGTSSWVQISKQVTGQASSITIFLKAQKTGGANNAQFDDAELTEQYIPPQQPTIGRAPATLSPSCSQGSNATDQVFTVQNTGSGTLSYSIGDNAAWLSCSPIDGTSTGESDTITVTYTTSSLSPGTYNATITIADAGATNNPQTIAVTLTVTSSGGPNLVANPGFEGGFTSGLAASWQSWTTAGTGYWRQSTRLGRIGAGMYNGTAGFSQTVRLNPKVVLLHDSALGHSAGIRASLPDALIIGRLYIDPQTDQYLSDPEYYGALHADNCYSMAQQKPGISAWQGMNEQFNSNDLDRAKKVARFEKAFALRCHVHGLKACVMNIAVGNPGDESYMSLQEVRDCLAVGDYVGYHSYGGIDDQLMIGPQQEWFSLRWRHYAATYEANGWRMPPVVYTECTTFYAWHGVFTATQIRDDLMAFEAESGNDPWSVGMAIFVMGSGSTQWDGWECATEPTIYEGCGDYNLSHPADAKEGLYSQQFGETSGGFAGGICQPVAVTSGHQYQLSHWMKCETYGVNTNVSYQVGYDLTGQTASPTAGSIVWTSDLIHASPARETDWWYEHSLMFTASGPQVSIWFKGSQAAGLDAWRIMIDEVSLSDTGTPPEPAMTCLPPWLYPTCPVGSNAPDQTFTVENTGGGTLSYAIDDNVTWLSCSPSSGQSTGEADTITVSYMTSSLSVGTYNAMIAVTSPYETQTVGVTLTVTSVQTFAPADFDQDNDVDQVDFGHFQKCLTGDGIAVTDQDCLNAKLDEDVDVDQADFAIFAGCLSGSGVSADPDCAGS